MSRGEGGGRPVKCTLEIREKYFAARAKGLSSRGAAAKIKVPSTTIDSWAEHDRDNPDLPKDDPRKGFWTQKMAAGDAQVLFHEERAIEPGLTPQQNTFTIFALKAADPETYGDKAKVEHSGVMVNVIERKTRGWTKGG